MERYGDFSPTQFDHHIELDEREDWLVLPVSQTRDSGCLAQSNFYAALGIMGGESENVEVHRFGHWGPGWFEIIIFNPADPELLRKAEDIERSLEDYPVLNEDDLSAREWEDMLESWDNYGAREFRNALTAVLESCLDEHSDTEPVDPQQRWCKHWGLAIDICGCGDCIETESEWIGGLIDKVDELDGALLRKLGADHFDLDHEYHSDGTYFRWNKKIDLQKLCNVLDSLITEPVE